MIHINQMTFPQEDGVFAYPDLGVDLNLLIIGFLGVKRVQADVVVTELGPNLHGKSRSVRALKRRVHTPNTLDA